MIRKAFVMSVNEGQEAEYERRHRPIWPELEQTLKLQHEACHDTAKPFVVRPQTSQVIEVVYKQLQRREDYVQRRLCKIHLGVAGEDQKYKRNENQHTENRLITVFTKE